MKGKMAPRTILSIEIEVQDQLNLVEIILTMECKILINDTIHKVTMNENKYIIEFSKIMCRRYHSTFHFTKYLPHNTTIEFLVKERETPNLVGNVQS